MTNERNIVTPRPRINSSFCVLIFDNNKGGFLKIKVKSGCKQRNIRPSCKTEGNYYNPLFYFIIYRQGLSITKVEDKSDYLGSTSVETRSPTHQLCCGWVVHEALWRPHRLKEGYNIPENDHQAEWKFEDENPTTAKEIIPLLEKGLADLKSRPEYFEKFNSPNGWGMYENFVPFVEEYLEACKEYPDAVIEVSR